LKKSDCRLLKKISEARRNDALSLFQQPSDYKPFPALRQSCSDVAIGKKAAKPRASNDRHPLLSDVLEII